MTESDYRSITEEARSSLASATYDFILRLRQQKEKEEKEQK